MLNKWIIIAGLSLAWSCSPEKARIIEDFNHDWKFLLGDEPQASETGYDDAGWRKLDLPHDWSIEGEFSRDHPATTSEGALPTGTGWYRKRFRCPGATAGQHVFVEFDGIYRNGEVWINGHYLGKRPNGYISCSYELTPYLVQDGGDNVIAVRVDNSVQPVSRWYTGSGIYRNVRLVTTGTVYIPCQGIFITTPSVSREHAKVTLEVSLGGIMDISGTVRVETRICDPRGKIVAAGSTVIHPGESDNPVRQDFSIKSPSLWSVGNPALYRMVTDVYPDNRLSDSYETTFGIRYFEFDPAKGFFLNGQPLKILGVCMHHDLGALGAAVNERAIERQLEILKGMGCNTIRTAHNPPAPELLDLCDRMGFIVMDELFDAWAKRKTRQGYFEVWDQWHSQDLMEWIRRDRNHPSVFIWSIGNEIREQFDSTGISITRELVQIIKDLDTTRPVTCALTENDPSLNYIYQSGALDILSFNYKQEAYPGLPEVFPGERFIASETTSALQTRGCYDMPSDSIRRWPDNPGEVFTGGNPDWTASAYDNASAYWGSTHEETWKVIKRSEHMAGLFVWTGFDYLGEPTPYPWPARSSYFGIVDLAGFPKDVYYMYQSEWTETPVLHLFPHWNWEPGQTVDVWAYYNNADEVELFLDGQSLGTREKTGDDLHVMWRVQFRPGTLKAVSRKNGREVLVREISTSGTPAGLELEADRDMIRADGKDLSFIKVTIIDEHDITVPYADNPVTFEVTGEGFLAGVDNGYQASLEPFRSGRIKAFRGQCLTIIRSTSKRGEIIVEASSEGLLPAMVTIRSR